MQPCDSGPVTPDSLSRRVYICTLKALDSMVSVLVFCVPGESTTDWMALQNKVTPPQLCRLEVCNQGLSETMLILMGVGENPFLLFPNF